MTSDAKAGLLLGLVFLFVIAFIVNGVPVITNAQSGNELTGAMIAINENQTIGNNERDVAIRYHAPLLNSNGSETITANNTQQTPPAGQPQIENPVAIVPPVNNIPEKTPERKITPPAKSIRTVKNTPLVEKYTVKSNDNLGKIAIKVYGKDLGNKTENVNKIFKANQGKLKNEHELFPGQVLIIPPIKEIASNTQNGKFREELFERVNTANKDSKKYKKYVVSENDCLWKIAQSQLGNGSRYTEIKKLNSDLINDNNVVVAGLCLKLPVH